MSLPGEERDVQIASIPVVTAIRSGVILMAIILMVMIFPNWPW